MTGLNKLRMNLTVMNTIVLLGLSVFIAVVLYATISLNRDSDINNSLEIYCAQLAGNLDYLESEDPESPELGEDRVNFQAFLEGLNKNNVTYMVWNENFEAVSASTHLNIDPQELKNLILRYVAEKQNKYWVANYRTDTQNLKV
ncbi:MAG: sensor histidine kinase, partial [Eubacterium sp.]